MAEDRVTDIHDEDLVDEALDRTDGGTAKIRHCACGTGGGYGLCKLDRS